MSNAPWTREELISWIKEAGVETKDAMGFFKFIDDVANMYQQKAIAAGFLPDMTDFVEAVREASATLREMSGAGTEDQYEFFFKSILREEDLRYIPLLKRYYQPFAGDLIGMQDQENLRYLFMKYSNLRKV